MIDIDSINERCLNDFQPGYAGTFITYHAEQFGWDTEFTRRVTCDAVRFLALCAVPPAGQEAISEAHVMVSSPIVDKIVDAIFLDTPLLMWLENTFGVKRLLHVPYYAHGETSPAIRDLRYNFTLAMMCTAGYEIDSEIWPAQLPANYKECIGGVPPPCHVKRG